MDIKDFVDNNPIEYVQNFHATLRDLEGANGKQVRDIEYFIKLRLRLEKEREEQIQAWDNAQSFLDVLRSHGIPASFCESTIDNENMEIECRYGDSTFTVKVVSKHYT